MIWDELEVPELSEKAPHVCTNPDCEDYMQDKDYWPAGTRVRLKDDPDKIGTIKRNYCPLCDCDMERVGLDSDPRS